MESPQRPSSGTSSRRRRRESKSKENIEMYPEEESNLSHEISEMETTIMDESAIHKKSKKSKKDKQLSQKKDSEDHNDQLAEKLSDLIDNVKVKKKKKKEKSTQKKNDKNEVEESKAKAADKTDQDIDKSIHSTATPDKSSDLSKKEKKKKQKSKKSTSKLSLLSGSREEICITSQLRDLKDDVIIVDENKEPEETILNVQNLNINPSTAHQEKYINATFHENINGFIAAKNKSGEMIHADESMQDLTQGPSRASHAIFLQRGFRTISVFCHGLLAGITVAHCLLIFLLSSRSEEIIKIYQQSLAHTFFSLVFFLTIICFVASCDRSNVCGTSVMSVNGINIPWIPGLYLASLVLSVIAVRVEDILTHHTTINDENNLQKQ
ncbi:unnamed protein product, partial [Meganyctiphanes norvegica]